MQRGGGDREGEGVVWRRQNREKAELLQYKQRVFCRQNRGKEEIGKGDIGEGKDSIVSVTQKGKVHLGGR